MSQVASTSPVKRTLPLRQGILLNHHFQGLLKQYRKEKDKVNFWPMWVKHNTFNLDWPDLKTLGIKTINRGDIPPYCTFEQLLNAVGYQLPNKGN